VQNHPEILGIEECHIGIENNKPDAILATLPAFRRHAVKLGTLQVKYPQGSAMAFGGRSWQNVCTKAFTTRWCYATRRKVITVAGKGRPANLR
jgi:hypothetical protein